MEYQWRVGVFLLEHHTDRERVMAKLKPGDKASSFPLPDQKGKKVKLTDFRGRKLLVCFYPKAMTSGCTKQA